MIPLLKTGEWMEVEGVAEDDLKDPETLVLKEREEKMLKVMAVMWMRP